MSHRRHQPVSEVLQLSDDRMRLQKVVLGYESVRILNCFGHLVLQTLHNCRRRWGREGIRHMGTALSCKSDLQAWSRVHLSRNENLTENRHMQGWNQALEKVGKCHLSHNCLAITPVDSSRLNAA